MIALLVNILILVIIGAIVWWIVTLLPLPDPFKRIAMIIVLLIFLLVALAWLTGYGGGGPIRFGEGWGGLTKLAAG